MESRQIVAFVPPSDSREVELLSQYNATAIDDAVASLFSTDLEDAIDPAIISGSRPDSSPGGFSIRLMLLSSKKITAGVDKRDMVMASGLIIDPMTKAITPDDQKGLSSVLVMDDQNAIARVDVSYLLTEEDKVAIRGRGATLGAKATKGRVPTGVIPLRRGMIVRFGVYGASALQQGSNPVTPGAIIALHGVTIEVDWDGKAIAQQLHISNRKYQVIRNEDNGERLSRFMDEAYCTPKIEGVGLRMRRMDAWPAGMFVSRNEEPAPSRGIDALCVPDAPQFMMPAGDPFMVHCGETQGQIRARLSAAGPESLPTRVICTVPLDRADAFTYETTVNNIKIPNSRALFALTIVQNTPTGQNRILVHCTITTGPQVEMLTATPTYKGQQVVLPALVACLTGPLALDVKIAGDSDIESGAFANCSNFTSYVGAIPPRLAQLTIPRAGFMVSHDYMLRLRVPSSVEGNREAALKNPNAYYIVDGDPNVNSKLLSLNSTKYGFFDEQSTSKITELVKESRGSESKLFQAIDAIISDLNGPIRQIATTHDFFVVGAWIPTPEVIAHQRELAASDIEVLMRGNEEMLKKKCVPDDFPDDVYAPMLEQGNPPPHLGHYAVHKSITNNEVVHNRIKNQLELGEQARKRKAVEGRNDTLAIEEMKGDD